jgi:triacylglycerol lipase
MGHVFAALSPARRRLMLSLTSAALALAVVVAFLVIEHRSRAVVPVPQDSLGPILLVPGYGGSTTGLTVMARALRATGRDATVVDLPGDGRGDLGVQVQTLAAVADAALARTGAGSVDVVGYSAGGVVARLWVRDAGGDAEARRVVTLGSPHHGTDLAGAAADFTPSQCPAACQQLTPDSTVLRSLNAGDETPAGPLFVSIRSTADQVVPPYSSVLSGATNVSLQAVCPGVLVTHGQLPADPLVIAITELEIGLAPPRAPTSADCRDLSS